MSCHPSKIPTLEIQIMQAPPSAPLEVPSLSVNVQLPRHGRDSLANGFVALGRLVTLPILFTAKQKPGRVFTCPANCFDLF
jgi:hypothetical protein